jgi:tRNA threonylcarbamoyladenosine biosynthesis protein TsaE
MIIDKITSDESETYRSAFDFSSSLEPLSVVALFGEVGVGKTVFVKGVCEGLRVSRNVSSPTFIIMNEYPGICRDKEVTIRHFDFYRIEKESDIEELGLNEFFEEPDTVSLIEWADHAVRWLPSVYWRVDLKKIDADRRELKISRMEN